MTDEEGAERVEGDEERIGDVRAAMLICRIGRSVAHDRSAIRTRHHYLLPRLTRRRPAYIIR